MLERKRIHVTPAEIANGKPGNEEQCPIALALQRAYPDLNLLVGKNCIILVHPTLNTDTYPFPPRIAEWIETYDYLNYVPPIEFTFPSFEE